MAFTLWNLFEASLLILNAVCVLHEERFLAKIGWGINRQNMQGFGEEPTVKLQILNLVRSIRTVARSIFSGSDEKKQGPEVCVGCPKAEYINCLSSHYFHTEIQFGREEYDESSICKQTSDDDSAVHRGDYVCKDYCQTGGFPPECHSRNSKRPSFIKNSAFCQSK